MLKKEKIRINRMLGSEGLVNELETGTYKNCTFKTWNGRKKSLTIYGIKSVE